MQTNSCFVGILQMILVPSINDYMSCVHMQVLGADAVRNSLTLMHSCGMYDSAGEFSFAVR